MSGKRHLNKILAPINFVNASRKFSAARPGKLTGIAADLRIQDFGLLHRIAPA
jgi:hypothetical protein